MSLIARKTKHGRIYRDSRNLLNQQVRNKEAEDLFLDDDCGGDNTQAKKAKRQIDATLLDVGINHDEE